MRLCCNFPRYQSVSNLFLEITITYNNGLTYDILSWNRGSAESYPMWVASVLPSPVNTHLAARMSPKVTSTGCSTG